MERMKEKILTEGEVMPGGILRGGSFLNQMIDTAFMKEVGEEVSRLFKDDGPSKILFEKSLACFLSFAYIILSRENENNFAVGRK